MRAGEILDVVARARLLVVSSLLGGRRVGDGAVGVGVATAICDFAAGIGLGLWGVVNDNDFFGKAVAVEVVPVGLPRAPTLPRRLVLGGRTAGSGHDARGRVVGHGGRVGLVVSRRQRRRVCGVGVGVVRGSRGRGLRVRLSYAICQGVAVGSVVVIVRQRPSRVLRGRRRRVRVGGLGCGQQRRAVV